MPEQHTDEAALFDPFAAVVDPYTPLQREADTCPVFDAKGGAVVVTGADNVAAVFKDAEDFRNKLRPLEEGVTPSLVHIDGEQHSRMRKLVVKAFTPRSIKNLEAPTYAIAHELIDKFVERGSANLCTEFAFILPAMVIAELVGIPEGDRSQFVKWADAAIAASIPESATYGDSDPALRDYVLGIIDQRRDDPGEDLLSELIAVHDGEDRLTTAELVSLIRQLILAGTDTTANLIGSMFHYLLSDPSRWERLVADRSLIPNVIEETLRMDPPLYWVPRRAARDVELAGHTIREGALVCNAVGAANRDPRLVDRPNEWDMDRPAAKNRTHYAFGYGEHFCIGSSLARLEATVVLDVVLDRLADLRLAGDYEFSPHGPMMMRGVKSMPIVFTPAAPR